MSQLFENYTFNSVNLDQSIYGPNNYSAQTFTIGTVGVNKKFTISNIVAWFKREGNPGECVAEIYLTNISGEPVGNILSSGTFDGNSSAISWGGNYKPNIIMSPFKVSKDTQYILVIRAPNGSIGNVLHCGGKVGSDYTGGEALDTNNNGSSWIHFNTSDFYFKIYGTLVPTSLEVTSSELYTSIVSDDESYDSTSTDSDSGKSYNQLFERYETNQYPSAEVYGVSCLGQAMHIGCSGDGTTHTPYSISIRSYRTGSPGTCYIFITNVDDVNYRPIGSPIASGSFNGDTLIHFQILMIY